MNKNLQKNKERKKENSVEKARRKKNSTKKFVICVFVVFRIQQQEIEYNNKENIDRN